MGSHYSAILKRFGVPVGRLDYELITEGDHWLKLSLGNNELIIEGNEVKDIFLELAKVIHEMDKEKRR